MFIIAKKNKWFLILLFTFIDTNFLSAMHYKTFIFERPKNDGQDWYLLMCQNIDGTIKRIIQPKDFESVVRRFKLNDPKHIKLYYDDDSLGKFTYNNINRTFGENEDTGLMLSAALGALENVRFFIENGADVSIKNKNGKTVFDLAMDSFQKESFVGDMLEKSENYLRTYKNDLEDGELDELSKEKRKELILDFNEKFVEDSVENKMRPLMRMAYAGNSKTVEYLIEKGAKVNQQNDDKRSAVHFAVYGYSLWNIISKRNYLLYDTIVEKYFKTIKSLVEAGADINLADKNGDTPLILAAKLKQWTIAEYFLWNGGDLYLKNNNEQCASDFVKDEKLKDRFEKIFFSKKLKVENVIENPFDVQIEESGKKENLRLLNINSNYIDDIGCTINPRLN